MNFRPPREHGTWGMFFVPFCAGWLAAGRTNIAVLLVLAAAAAVFLARESLQYWWRARRRGGESGDSGRALALYAAVAVACAAFLAGSYRLYGLIPLGLLGGATMLLNAEFGLRRQGRSAATELAGIAGSSLNAIAAHYAAIGAWSATGVWAWLLCTLYFGSSIFYVKLRVQDAHGKTEAAIAQARRRCAFYHAGLIGALFAFALTRSLSWLIVTAFAPILIRAAVQLLRPSRELNLKRIGWLEVSYSIFFLGLIASGLRGWR